MAFQFLQKFNAPRIIRILIEELTINARDYATNRFSIPFHFPSEFMKTDISLE